MQKEHFDPWIIVLDQSKQQG
jgi:hypothetical protein